jgi:hypothetical protein
MSIGAKMLKQMQYLIDAHADAPAPAKPLDLTLWEDPIQVQAQVSAYDTLGVALQALTVRCSPGDAPLETVARAINERVTYLWEPLALIERDLEREQAQMRSAPPRVDDEAIEFYEGELSRQNGSLQLRLLRYRRKNGQTRSEQVPLTLTHDVCRRLTDDVAGILSGTASVE